MKKGPLALLVILAVAFFWGNTVTVARAESSTVEARDTPFAARSPRAPVSGLHPPTNASDTARITARTLFIAQLLLPFTVAKNIPISPLNYKQSNGIADIC